MCATFDVPLPHMPRVKNVIGRSGINNDEVESARLLHRLRVERELQLGRADNLRGDAPSPELNRGATDEVDSFQGNSDWRLALRNDERLDRMNRRLWRPRRIRDASCGTSWKIPSARTWQKLRASTRSPDPTSGVSPISCSGGRVLSDPADPLKSAGNSFRLLAA